MLTSGLSGDKKMKKIANRMIQCILTMFIVSIICFALIKAAPGDPVLTYVEPNMSEEYIANLRESLGLTKPVWEQYIIWLGKILHGNFGNSLMNGRPVLTQIVERLPATVILMGSSMVLGFIIALFLAQKRNVLSCPTIPPTAALPTFL